MDEIYDFHQHTHFAVFHLKKETTEICCYSNSTKYEQYRSSQIEYNDIAYDRNTLDVLKLGHNIKYERDMIPVNVSEERLYELFKKSKNSLDEEDLFLFTAASDFIRLSLEKAIEQEEKI
ncbi:hypothetical protein BDF21DRAFT_422528, partial [Thamnidium elegans]